MKSIIKNKMKLVTDLKDKINNSQIVIIFEYSGLPVNIFAELRYELRKVDSNVKVYPNNIMKRAVVEANYNDLVTFFKGNKALIYSSSNVINSAKIIYEFSQKTPMIKIISGIVENKIASYEDIYQLASLPSKENLLTMLAFGMLMPITHLSVGLNMLLDKKNYKTNIKKDNEND